MAIQTEELIQVRDAAIARTRSELINGYGFMSEQLTLMQQAIEGAPPERIPNSDEVQLADAVVARFKRQAQILTDSIDACSNGYFPATITVRLNRKK